MNTWGYMAEHMRISNLTGKPLKNAKQSAISDHLLKYNCVINFDNFSILAIMSLSLTAVVVAGPCM